jgi:hypothetical protein
MSLRIACDLDGTVADMGAALRREARYLFGERVEMGGPAECSPDDAIASWVAVSEEAQVSDAPLSRPLTQREQDRLWRHVRESDNFWETLPEIEPGAVARFSAAAAKARWDVIFLTQRPSTAGDTVQLQSQRWLRAHGFELPSVCVVSGSRGKVAASLSLDAVIDDRPDNCLDVSVDSGAMPVLLWRQAPERLPPGVSRLHLTVVSTMAEAIDHLSHLHTPPSAPRGLLSRLRQALHAS